MNVKATPGSIYDGFSPAGQRALAQLRAAFQDAGFSAEKERATEASLRVYPERRGLYPLLNPRFVRARADSPVAISAPSIVCAVYSDRDESITTLLQRLPPMRGCTFKAEAPRARSRRYRLHGFFVLPLVFLGDRREQDVDFEALKTTLSELYLQISAGLLLGQAAMSRVPSRQS